jgi:two-component system cell cycle response regulator
MRPPKRVLVVDDNPVNLEIIQEILDDTYVVLLATNGRDAVRLAETYRPRIVLLDVMLPGVDGYQVCRRLRSLPRMDDARIIMVSAKAMPSERQQGLDAGADDYVTKPFDDADLLAAIRGGEEAVAETC